MPVLALVRHGQSLWNAENRFTGWEDIDLSPKGEKEAVKAGQILAEKNIVFQRAWTSCLKRANNTLKLILKELKTQPLFIHSSWRLNERHYGALQGLNKDSIKNRHGANQFFQWRRSFNVSPPPLPEDSPKHPSKNPLYKNIPKNLLPSGESLKDTMSRVLPLWSKEIAPCLKKGENILITAHGNSLRSLVKHIQNISDEKIPLFEIPTARPLIAVWEHSKDVSAQPVDFQFLNYK